MGIQVRVDVQTEEKTRTDLDEFIDHYKPKAYTAVREDSGNNPHYHIYVSLPSEVKDIAKVRGWWKYRGYTKDNLCVKKWGDEPHDMHYFFKGDKETGKVDCLRTTIDVFAQEQMNETYWQENARIMHEKARRKAPNMIAVLIADCQAAGAKTQMEVVRVFAESRVGLAGLCRFKHGPIIRSAWLHLNRSEKVNLDEMVIDWTMKIFMSE